MAFGPMELLIVLAIIAASFVFMVLAIVAAYLIIRWLQRFDSKSDE